MFLIVFKTREALPLTFVRFWRPRSSRGEGTEQPRHTIDSRPRHQPIREFDSPVNRAHVRTLHVRAQSATAFRPCTQTQQETVRDHNHTLAPTVREQASAVKINYSQPVRALEPSTSPIATHAKNINDSRLASKRPQQCISVSMLTPIQFTVRVRNISSHEHL